MAKRIAIYGTWTTKEWMEYRQRYWHKKKSGGKQRYWQKVKRTKTVIKSDGRFEFIGSGKELSRAIISTKYDGWVPNGYQITTANEFLHNPEKYSKKGKWLNYEVESL